MFLELDTPGSSVNIFTRAAAMQIQELFGALRSDEAKLIVFRSSKPFSFMNGTELVSTGPVNCVETADELSRRTRLAYRAIEQSPIPTVSAIEGSCFGCGVEFALCTDYRVASDSFDTCFYMTELKDYYFPPIFGALEKLPRLLGLTSAVEFLLVGQKWRALQACERGLIDEVFPAEEFDRDLRRFLDSRLLSARRKRPIVSLSAPPSATLATDVHRVLCWIDGLPAEQKALYRLTYAAMLEGLKSPDSADFRRKCADAFQSIFVSDAWKNAISFFFIRTIARSASLGTSSLIPESAVSLRLPATDIGWYATLRRRKIKGLTLESGASSARPELIGTDRETTIPFDVQWGHDNTAQAHGRPLIYFPSEDRQDICEVFLPRTALREFRPMLVFITHLGWQPIVRPLEGRSVLNTFIAAHAHGQARVHGEAQALLDAKILRHWSQVDVAVQALFDLPLSLESFSHSVEARH